ncbi:hypothetical protein [Aquabacter cavernae]|uniref:hypothetical protein n=1 Tax=Aquabacter cavernae TaxID=2496029 RepID=UPI000F8F336E|nr:hypothetical protein [Aquabacter cavernae]
MRDLKDYTLRDWAGAQPLTQGARRLRNVLLDSLYATRRCEGQDALLSSLAPLRGRFLAVTVAFNLPEAVAFLSDAMARTMPDVPLLVCDNSSDPAMRVRIAAICARSGRAYCPLPAVPRISPNVNGSRSHGVALNWIWRNILRPLRPSGFALLDHDLIPLAPDDLAARVARQPVYGMVRAGEDFGGWYLWPGYSVFDFKAVETLPLDFGTDTPRMLDTGGQNWRVLYRHLSLDDLAQARTRQVWLAAEGEGPEPFLLADTWLHVGGAGHRGGGAAALRRVRRLYDADPDRLLCRLSTDPVDAVSVLGG